MKYFPLYYCILLIFVISLNEKTTSSYFCEKIILWKKLNFINGFVSEMCNQYLSFLSIIICILYHSILYFVRLTICLACKEQTFWIIDLVLDNYMTITYLTITYLTITWQLLDNYLTITWQLLDNYVTITWQLHNNYVTITWLLLENYLTITQIWLYERHTTYLRKHVQIQIMTFTLLDF